MEAKPPVMGKNPSRPFCSHQNSWEFRMFIQPNHHIIDGYIYIQLYYICIYNYTGIPVCPLFHYTPIFVGLNPNQICYRFWSIWYHRSRVLLKPCHNQCLGLCKALGFLLPLHLRPYPRSLVVERWFSDMATLTHGTSSIVNLPGWLPLKLEVQKKNT